MPTLQSWLRCIIDNHQHWHGILQKALQNSVFIHITLLHWNGMIRFACFPFSQGVSCHTSVYCFKSIFVRVASLQNEGWKVAAMSQSTMQRPDLLPSTYLQIPKTAACHRRLNSWAGLIFPLNLWHLDEPFPTLLSYDSVSYSPTQSVPIPHATLCRVFPISRNLM